MRTNQSDLQLICQAIKLKYGNQALIYGEGHEIITENQGSNYVSITDSKPCSVDDNFDLVVFFIRESWEPVDDLGSGLRNNQYRNVNFKLCANAKGPDAEFNLAVILNQILPTTGGDNNAKQIAQTYFGLNEHNFETYFFTIDFVAKESLVCEKC
jgi:hypothetical protein